MKTYPCPKCADAGQPFLLTGESVGVVQCARCYTTYPAIVEDSGWQHAKYSSIPSRGINDYTRVVKFATPFHDDMQFKAVCHWMEHDNCPGWTGVNGRLMSAANSTRVEYCFTTTYDSSD